MEDPAKYILKGCLFLILSIIFMIWGLSDIFSVINDPSIRIIVIILAIIIPVIITIYIFVKMSLKSKKLFFLNEEKWLYNCSECGAKIKLEYKVCGNCGMENTLRKTVLERIETLEQSIEENKTKLLEKLQSSGEKSSSRGRKEWELAGEQLKRLNQQANKIISLKNKLLNTYD